MPPVPPPAAREWFRHFTDEFDRSLTDDSTEVRIHDDKWAVRGRDAAHDPEWNPCNGHLPFAFPSQDELLPGFRRAHESGAGGASGFRLVCGWPRIAAGGCH